MVDRTRIELREIRALLRGEEIWDGVVRGFGARRRVSTAVSYFVMYRTPEGRLRRYTIGRHGAPWTPDTARIEALRILGEKVKGSDPAAAKQAKRRAETVNGTTKQEDCWRMAALPNCTLGSPTLTLMSAKRSGS
jgi:hypothetical protein